MSIQAVKEYLRDFGLEDKIQELNVSSATVELAAAALGVGGERIAKTISLENGEGCMLVVAAGDTKIDNAKFKARFGFKARMLTPEQALAMTGHAVGGVCPFALPDGVSVYLDDSLRRFPTVFPACGSANSAIELTLDELERASDAAGWVDVCKMREPLPQDPTN